MAEQQPPGISAEDLEQLVGQLKAEEVDAEDARLNSLESLELWVRTHPALQQAVFVENLGQLGPAILQAIRAMLGL